MLIDSDRLRQSILTTMPERSEVLLIVDNQPEGVVRCKDCKHSEKVNNIYVCGVDRHYVITRKSDWFCADGERR